MFIGTLSGYFHEDITEQLKGTTEAAEAGCDLDQSAMDRTIIVAIAGEETRTALFFPAVDITSEVSHTLAK